MIKIINIFIPFLIEVLFGKKDEPQNQTDPKNKRTFLKSLVYVAMMLSFSFNYFSINKVYTLSLGYVALRKELAAKQTIVDAAEGDKARANQLEKSLQYCMSNTYKPKRVEGKNLLVK